MIDVETGFLLSRLLRTVAISEALQSAQGENLVFKEMQYGKPYLVCNSPSSPSVILDKLNFDWPQESPSSSPALGFNLSHDDNVILFAVRRHEDVGVARDIGVDVMHIALPKGESFEGFVETLASAVCPFALVTHIQMTAPQYTPHELAHLRTLASQDEAGSEKEATAVLFTLWTLKESYVKALGVGITFDLSRIEYDFAERVLRVDGVPLRKWKISSFRFNGLHAERVEEYVGALCCRVQEGDTGGLVVSRPADLVEMDVRVLIDKMEFLVSPYPTVTH
jgi:phosphopantetheinyl transferase